MESMQRSWKILHIDDDEDDFILTRSMLAQAQSRKITLEWASSLEAGRDTLRANNYDAVLVDYDLGLVTGIALIRDMVAEGYTAPLILYTGRGSYAVDVEAMQAGATMYLSKSEATPLLLERIIRYAIERKQTELAQAETQERFRAVLEYSMDVAYRRNLIADRYDYMSPVVEKVLGFTPEEMDSMSLEDLLSRIHPQDLENVTASLQQASGRGSAQVEYRFCRKDGSYRWLADYFTVQFDRFGKPVNRVGNLRDIHEQKQIEEDLRASEAMFRQIFAVGAVGVQLWNESGELLEVNDAFLQLVGYTRADFDSGRLNWRQLTPPDYQELDEHSIRQMREGVIPTPYEKELWHKDGRRVPVLVAVNQLGQNPDGSLTGVAYFFDMSEQRQAIDALRASEERFRLSAQAVNGLVYDWNLITGESFHSQGVEMMLGFSSDISTKNNWWFQNIHPDDFPAASAHLQEYMEGNYSQFEIEYRVRHADGHWAHIWDRGVIKRDDKGKAVRIVGFATDISERQRLVEENRRQQELLERMMSETPAGIAYLHGPEHQYQYVNKAYEHLARGRGELIGRKVAEVWPEAIEVLSQRLNEVYQTGKIFTSHEFVIPANREEGQGRGVFDVAFIPMFDQGGQVEGVLVHVIDITEQVAARKTIEAERALMSAVMNQMLSGVAIAEAPSGRLIRLNERMSELFGFLTRSADGIEDYGRLAAHRADGTLLKAEDWPLARSILTGEVVRDEEVTIELPDGGRRILNIRSNPVTDASGQIIVAVAIVDDITERKKVEDDLHEYMQRLQRSNQDLQDFAFTISHDLQEPLRKVEAFGRLLLRDGAGGLSSEQVDYIHRMQHASERMRAMIEGMLAYSRVSTQANPFELVDLNQVAQEVLQDYELRIQRTGSRVEVGPLPVLEADPVQMRQLLQNLLENALKYARPEVNPVVKISSREEPGGFFALLVEDNGIGIDPTHFPGLFKPFFRLHNTTEYDGAGMGLATVRRIVERHAGIVRVESQPGQGSTFIVRLPAKHA